jgi:outer membrane protein TolC
VQFIDAGQLQLTPEQIEAIRTFLGDGFVGMLSSLNEPMEIQKRVTGTVTLQAVQPITPLWSLAEIFRLQGANAEAAELEQRARTLQVTYRVTETFFRLRQALRMVQ